MNRLHRALSLAALVAAFLLLAPLAKAHDPYENYAQIEPKGATSIYDGKQKPNGGSCCGGTDCARLTIEPGVLEAVAEGYRITLTLEQARKINPFRERGTSFVVPWAEIQESFDGDFHLCIPNGEQGMAYYPEILFYCFWAPPNT